MDQAPQSEAESQQLADEESISKATAAQHLFVAAAGNDLRRRKHRTNACGPMDLGWGCDGSSQSSGDLWAERVVPLLRFHLPGVQFKELCWAFILRCLSLQHAQTCACPKHTQQISNTSITHTQKIATTSKELEL